jgi:hypothetical protein
MQHLMQPHFRDSIRGDLPLEPHKPAAEQISQPLCPCAPALVSRYRFCDQVDDLDEKCARPHRRVHDNDIVVRIPPVAI